MKIDIDGGLYGGGFPKLYDWRQGGGLGMGSRNGQKVPYNI